MNNNQIDADKIVRHIKYTKHWLDKANSDFNEQNFASGSAILNLARAELTTAWEEAMQLKTELFRTVPKKAKANWNPAASIGLLASGFMIALVITKFAPNTTTMDASGPAPAIVLPQQPVAEPAETVAIQPAVETQKTETAANTSRPTVKHSAAGKAVEATSKTAMPMMRNISVPPLAPTPVVTPEPVAQPAVAEPAPVQPVALKKTNELNQSEVIELFKTAETSLKK
jgi:hypothetical protein